jgi:hypothetical protein
MARIAREPLSDGMDECLLSPGDSLKAVGPVPANPGHSGTAGRRSSLGQNRRLMADAERLILTI